MTSEQRNLFGTTRSNPKAKALPKIAPPSASPPKPSALSPAHTIKAAKNLASVRAARARARVGDIRMSGVECKVCGAERIEELIAIEPAGGQTWTTICISKICKSDML